MKLRSALFTGAALLATCFAINSALAHTNFFRPISGAEFDERQGCAHVDGEIVAGGTFCFTSASLGHAQGGTNG
jgi:hypothetical protein